MTSSMNFNILKGNSRKMRALLCFLIIILSGCAEKENEVKSKDNKDVATNVLQSIEDRDYKAAREIYQDAIAGSSEEEVNKIDQALSNKFQEYMDDRFTKVSAGTDTETAIEGMLVSIQEAQIGSSELEELITKYSLLGNGTAVSGNVTENILIAIEERNYIAAWEIYQDAIAGSSEEEVTKIDQALSDKIQEYIDDRFAKVGTGTDTEVAIEGMLNSIRETQIGGKILTDLINIYSPVQETIEIGNNKQGEINVEEELMETNLVDSNIDTESPSPYTREELEVDPNAPSINPDDYNEDGEYVPEDGPSDNPEDYNSNGEYQPVEDMTQEEIEAQLTDMLEGSLSP
ncbi:hypothetical protein AWH48_14760 [Domibacillus aminovorans]|uniref:Uncharacterized protein n=1 Tax=Domibacillus aminovorans TaxID=29332 RepID=A0A177L168_9BACI|nr:hypothetical protein [Domibacillus aminovorans]OAH59399.1 hypothetical protein AWH48_14760 [Domibacillus aminovorans]